MPELSPGGGFGQLSVATTGGSADDGADLRSTGYRLPGVIPPHQWRDVRLTWANGPCQPAAGAGIIIDQLIPTVRVGGLDRTETLPLIQAYAVISRGPSTCPGT